MLSLPGVFDVFLSQGAGQQQRVAAFSESQRRL